MFAFRLWSHFGVFRDPITITQNVTFSIPPKTTIGGMLAAILGIDYNDYFNDPEYFDFKYSLVLKSPIRKQSFSQNYIEDYTGKSHLKHDSMKKVIYSALSLEKVIEENDIKNQDSFFNTDENVFNEEIEKAKGNYQKDLKKFWDRISGKMPKPKPIRRELLINPNYLIFIKDFKFEKQAISILKSHNSGFAFYMGNSEFSANYKFVECEKSVGKYLSQIESFTQSNDNISFESGKKYTTIYAATKAVNDRQYRDYKRITISDNGISFQEPVKGYFIQTSIGDYRCEFI